MKVAIIGSRNFMQIGLVISKINELRDNYPDLSIISGGASGVDTQAQKTAEYYGIAELPLLPDYTKYGDNAPHERNDMIIETVDKVIAFWTGERVHSGTWSVISKCLQRHKNIEVIFDRKALE